MFILPAVANADKYWPIIIVFVAPAVALFVIVLLRYGVVSATVAATVFALANLVPATTDFSVWYASGVLIPLGALAALGIYGFRTAVAGRPMFPPSATKAASV